MFGKDETRKVRFDKVGTVAVGCNIHDSMVAFEHAGGLYDVAGVELTPALARWC